MTEKCIQECINVVVKNGDECVVAQVQLQTDRNTVIELGDWELSLNEWERLKFGIDSMVKTIVGKT